MLETISKISNPQGGFDLEKLDYHRRTGIPANLFERYAKPNVWSTGRVIEAMVRFYETTGDPLALDLAGKFARYHMENSTNPDGTINHASEPNHTHSYLGMLRGLLLYMSRLFQPNHAGVRSSEAHIGGRNAGRKVHILLAGG